MGKQQVEEQKQRLEGIAKQSVDLSGDIKGLLRELAGGDDQNGGFGVHFASVEMTRHLKASTAAVSRGPMAKVVVPDTSKKLAAPLSMFANLNQMRKLHGSLL